MPCWLRTACGNRSAQAAAPVARNIATAVTAAASHQRPSKVCANCYAFRFVPQEFFPDSDRNQFLAYLDLPAGTHIDESSRTVEEVATWLADTAINPEVTGTIAYVGTGGPRFFLSLAPIDPDPHRGFVIVNVESNDQVLGVVERMRRHLRDRYPDVNGKVMAMWMGASERGLLELRLVGPDAEVLVEKAQRLMAGLNEIPGGIDVEHDWENQVLKLEILVDQDRARRAGVSSEEVANSLATFIEGSRVSDYREADDVMEATVTVFTTNSSPGNMRWKPYSVARAFTGFFDATTRVFISY